MKTKTKTLIYKGQELLVSSNGDIWHDGKKLIPNINRKTGYKSVSVKTDEGWLRPYVHRIVCMAFHPIEGQDYSNLQCDHINSLRDDCRASNLRWMTRQQNNSRKHARIMRMKNKKRTDHSTQYVKAFNPATGEIRYFKNGHQTAEAFGCSSPLVYMALDGKTPSCYGWRLEWVSNADPEVKDFHAEVKRRAQMKKQKNRISLSIRRRREYAKKRGDAYRPHKTYKGKPLPEIEQEG